jgi:hypothetical protein
MNTRVLISFLFLLILFSGCSSFKGQRSFAQVDQNEFIQDHNKAIGVYNLESGTPSCPKLLELQWSQGKAGNTAIFMDQSAEASFGFSNYEELGAGADLAENVYVEALGATDSAADLKEKFYHFKGKREFSFTENILSSHISSEVRRARSLDDKTFIGQKVEGRKQSVEVDYSRPSRIIYKYFEKNDRTLMDFRGKKLDLECVFKKKV